MKKDRVLKGVLILLSIVFLFCIKAFLFNNSRILDRQNNVSGVKLNENKAYYSKNDVALYLHTFKRLPKNYLTKNEAKKLGWDSSKGNLWKVTDKGVIGGDVFSNREGKLPKKDKYFEADVNYKGGKRELQG